MPATACSLFSRSGESDALRVELDVGKPGPDLRAIAAIHDADLAELQMVDAGAERPGQLAVYRDVETEVAKQARYAVAELIQILSFDKRKALKRRAQTGWIGNRLGHLCRLAEGHAQGTCNIPRPERTPITLILTR